jgi:hypothetical protein
MAAAFSRHVTVRPDFERVISPASVSTSICFITAGSDIWNGFASSLIDRPSDASSRASSARRVGSARAAKVRSSGSVG